MQKILTGLGGDQPFCSVYIDDILVFSRTVEEHVDHLKQIFGRLTAAGLKLHSKKCHFAQPEVVYLGHVISSKGTRPDLGKVRAVENFPVPTSVKEVKRFLGMASYYRQFVPNFAKIATPSRCTISLDKEV